MAGERSGETELRYISSDGVPVMTTLGAARVDLVSQGRPVRRFGWHTRMRHYQGWWWSATVRDHVGYESLLELGRLILADFDRDTVAIASQPFGVTGLVGDKVRRHVPDYLLLERGGGVVVVDVKPAEFLDRPGVSEVLEWTGRLMAERGWRYEVWSGADPVLMTNLRFLSVGRHCEWVDRGAVDALVAQARAGMTVREAVDDGDRACSCGRAFVQAAALMLLWEQRWVVDLSSPLSGDTTIARVEEVADVVCGA